MLECQNKEFVLKQATAGKTWAIGTADIVSSLACSFHISGQENIKTTWTKKSQKRIHRDAHFSIFKDGN